MRVRIIPPKGRRTKNRRVGKSKRRAALRVLARLGIAVLCVAAVCAGAVWYLRGQGKRALYGAAQNSAPELSAVDGTEEEEEAYTPDDGTVRYQGKDYRYKEDILTFLVMGIDHRGKLPAAGEVTDYTQGGQADALFLAVIDPREERISLVAINRNAMGEVDVYDEDNIYVRTDLLQICLQHGYGSGLADSCKRQVEAVSRLFYFLPIHGYVSVEMGAIPVINDSVDGVEVTLLEQIPKGSSALRGEVGESVSLSGEDAYYYVQYRDTDVFDSASLRLARQKQYLSAFIKKAVEKTKGNLTFPATLLGVLSDYVLTDLDASRLTYLATSYVGYDIDLDSIYTLEGETVTGAGGFEEFYVDDDALYALIIDLFYEEAG